MAQNNPLKGIDKARSRKMKPITVLTPDQAENLLRCASPKIIPFFAIGMFAGLRIDEIMKLDWKHINLVNRKIDLTWFTTKTQRLQAYGPGRIMPLVTRTSATGWPLLKTFPKSLSKPVTILRRLLNGTGDRFYVKTEDKEP